MEHSALVAPLRDIQFYTRRRRPGIYQLREAWTAYVPVAISRQESSESDWTDACIAEVWCQEGTLIKICRTQGRLNYHIQLQDALLCGLFTLDGEEDEDAQVKYGHLLPDCDEGTEGARLYAHFCDEWDCNHEADCDDDEDRVVRAYPSLSEARRVFVHNANADSCAWNIHEIFVNDEFTEDEDEDDDMPELVDDEAAAVEAEPLAHSNPDVQGVDDLLNLHNN